MTKWIEAWRREKDPDPYLGKSEPGFTMYVDTSMKALKKVYDDSTVFYARLFLSYLSMWKRGKWTTDLESTFLKGEEVDEYRLSMLSKTRQSLLDNLRIEIALLHSGDDDEDL